MAVGHPYRTLPQVFELADLVGRRPVGNVRKTAAGSFRLRYLEPGGEMCVSPGGCRSHGPYGPDP